jgi:hypothetical protein
MHRLSVWAAIAIVFLSGIVAWLLEAALTAPVVLRHDGWASLHRSAATAALGRPAIASIVLGILLEAAVVKLAVAVLTPFRIRLLRSAAAGMVATALAMLPLVVLLTHPIVPGGPVPGVVIGAGVLMLPVAIAALVLQGWLIAVLAERPGSGGSFAGYTRALGRA